MGNLQLLIILFISPLANFKLVQFSNVLELFFPFAPLIMLKNSKEETSLFANCMIFFK